MALVWSDQCIPNATNATLDINYLECCSARFTFSLSGEIVSANGSTYYPNKCSASPTTESIVIGPMVVDMEVVSDGIFVDDELLVNGAIYEAGQYPVTLCCLPPDPPASTAYGTPFAGGTSECNGAHTISAGKVLATIPQGGTVVLAGGDNHGITLVMNGAIILRTISAP